MKPINILLVEDNEGDILLTTEALEEGKILNNLQVVKDGHEAISLLNREGQYAGLPLPDLVLLDVNLPKKNGHEVLYHIKESPQLKHIPVITLTTSSAEMDVVRAYKNHANCYITKPVEADSFISVVTSVEEFWVSIVQLPSKFIR